MPAGWGLSLYPEAGEAGGGWSAGSPRSSTTTRRGTDGVSARSIEEAARRARARVRRYCVANGLNRMGTLTYAQSQLDPEGIRADLGVFFRNLRLLLGGTAFPYVWVPEWHPGGHGLHAHFAVGRFISKRLLEEAWGHGFVHIKLLSDMPYGATRRDEARLASGYLSKYLSKAFTEREVLGRHRYDVAEGFQPVKHRLFAPTREAVLEQACAVMGARPSYQWLSPDGPDWDRPPALWVMWS